MEQINRVGFLQVCLPPESIETIITVYPSTSKKPYSIMKINEWLQTRMSKENIASRYAQKQVNPQFYGYLSIGGK